MNNWKILIIIITIGVLGLLYAIGSNYMHDGKGDAVAYEKSDEYDLKGPKPSPSQFADITTLSYVDGQSRLPETESKSEPQSDQNVTSSSSKCRGELGSEFDAQLDNIATSRGVDPSLVRAIISVESNWTPGCVGDHGASLGLMQIQPRWHQSRMSRLGVTDLLDPISNVTVGVDILADLISKYGEYKALNAYNTGNPNNSNGYADTVLSVKSKLY